VRAGFTENVGREGMFIFAHEPEIVGTKLQIVVTLAGNDIEVVAEVVFVEGARGGCGVRIQSAPQAWHDFWDIQPSTRRVA